MCRAVRHDPIYVLDQSLQPGERVTLDTQSSKRRDLERRITRRRITHEQKETITTWDEAGQDVTRILEVMMFHEAAGGQPYTKVGGRYQSYVDLSEQLRLGRAILMGRAEVPATVWLRDVANRWKMHPSRIGRIIESFFR